MVGRAKQDAFSSTLQHPSQKKGQCLLCDNSPFSQTMNQPHCPTACVQHSFCSSRLTTKGRNRAKKLGMGENQRPHCLTLPVKRVRVSHEWLQTNGYGNMSESQFYGQHLIYKIRLGTGSAFFIQRERSLQREWTSIFWAPQCARFPLPSPPPPAFLPFPICLFPPPPYPFSAGNK